MSDDLFPGFASHWINTEAGKIFARSAGDGPPLVLLHGFPQTHAIWHRIAPALSKTHTVVCMDMRGYGWSSAPPSHGGEGYAKRVIGGDVVAVMEELGHVRFAFAGHDRGARVGYRLALDQPGRIERLALLDILPTFEVWKRMRADVQPKAHWQFLSGPEPQPETEIGRDPVGYFDGLLRQWTRSKTLEAFDPRALAAYRQSGNEPSRIHAFCEDYRAGATIDVAQDEADMAAGNTIGCPAFLVWSEFYLKRGDEPPLATWDRTFAPGITGAEVPSGHFLAEEAPAETLAALQGFLTAPA